MYTVSIAFFCGSLGAYGMTLIGKSINLQVATGLILYAIVLIMSEFIN